MHSLSAVRSLLTIWELTSIRGFSKKINKNANLKKSNLLIDLRECGDGVGDYHRIRVRKQVVQKFDKTWNREISFWKRNYKNCKKKIDKNLWKRSKATAKMTTFRKKKWKGYGKKKYLLFRKINQTKFANLVPQPSSGSCRRASRRTPRQFCAHRDLRPEK